MNYDNIIEKMYHPENFKTGVQELIEDLATMNKHTEAYKICPECRQEITKIDNKECVWCS